jgi:hypothetical protein
LSEYVALSKRRAANSLIPLSRAAFLIDKYDLNRRSSALGAGFSSGRNSLSPKPTSYDNASLGVGQGRRKMARRLSNRGLTSATDIDV